MLVLVFIWRTFKRRESLARNGDQTRGNLKRSDLAAGARGGQAVVDPIGDEVNIGVAHRRSAPHQARKARSVEGRETAQSLDQSGALRAARRGFGGGLGRAAGMHRLLFGSDQANAL